MFDESINGTRTGVVGSLDEKERREAHIPIENTRPTQATRTCVDLLNFKFSTDESGSASIPRLLSSHSRLLHF
jgi:hypothetical protein